jgi:hypothetical protein
MFSGESTSGNCAADALSSSLSRFIDSSVSASMPVDRSDRNGYSVCITSRARRRYTAAGRTRGRYGRLLMSSIMSYSEMVKSPATT